MARNLQRNENRQGDIDTRRDGATFKNYHIFIYVIKLKDIILEMNRPTISKMEENYAFQMIIKKLLPHVIYLYNFYADHKWGVPNITLEEAKKQLRKLRVEHFTNGQAIEYGIKLTGTTLSFKIQKLNRGRKHDSNEDIIDFEVGFYDFTSGHWGDIGWNVYDVKGLVKGNYDLNLNLV